MSTEISTSKLLVPDCKLCSQPGGELLWDIGFARVLLADEPDYPGFCRVILNTHHKEMTDIPTVDRVRLMTIVFAVESLVRELLQPDKINLASLGNMVAHIHWHIIPRYSNDAHFPDSVWSTRRRTNSRGLTPGFADNMRRILNEQLRDT